MFYALLDSYYGNRYFDELYFVFRAFDVSGPSSVGKSFFEILSEGWHFDHFCRPIFIPYNALGPMSVLLCCTLQHLYHTFHSNHKTFLFSQPKRCLDYDVLRHFNLLNVFGIYAGTSIEPSIHNFPQQKFQIRSSL